MYFYSLKKNKNKRGCRSPLQKNPVLNSKILDKQYEQETEKIKKYNLRIFVIVHSSLKIKSRPFIITCLNDVSRNKSIERCRIEILCPRLFGCIIFLLVHIFLLNLVKNELISLFHFLYSSLWYITCLIFFPFKLLVIL